MCVAALSIHDQPYVHVGYSVLPAQFSFGHPAYVGGQHSDYLIVSQLQRAATLDHHVAHVVELRAEKEMRGANAGRVVAMVQHGLPLNDGGIMGKAPRDMSCSERLGMMPALADFPVTLSVKSPCPNPAGSEVGAVIRDRSILIDLFPEAVCQRAWSRPFAVKFRGNDDMVSLHMESPSMCHGAGRCNVAALSLYPISEQQ
jgi:hypothetical protein